MTVISLPRVREQHERAHTLERSAGALETSAGPIRLTVFRDFKAVEDEWNALQARGLCVPAQSYEHAEAWFRLVSRPAGGEAAIVCGRTEGGGLQFIWPFEAARTNGIRCLRWIGWEHANYAMGLHTLDFVRKVSRNDVKRLLSEAANLVGDISAALFDKQPLEWDGAPNPMALLPHRPSANMGHSVLLETDFDMLYRNRFSGKSRNTLRRKERRLRDEGLVEIGWAQSAAERSTLLDKFFMQKARQFAEQGIGDSFADPRYRNFYHEMAAMPSGQDGTLEIGYLSVAGKVAAISCGVFFKDKFTTLLTSIDEGPVRRNSPGTLLLHFQIEDVCRRGLNFFDMGAGDARHKDEWCDVHTPLFETSIAFDERGYLLTLPRIVKTGTKRFIKTRPMLWSLAQTVRRGLYGQRSTTFGRGEPEPDGSA